MRAMAWSAAVIVCLVSVTASAQESAPVEVVYPRRTVIHLEGRTVEGNVEGPSGSMIQSRPPGRFNRMILVRQSFAVELLGSHHHL